MSQELVDLFATTYNADPNCQKAGELKILEISGQEGMISAILDIIASDGVELATRQACSVYLKNRVHSSYAIEPSSPPRPDQIPIPQSDRHALRASILRLLAASPSRAITVQLAATLKDLVVNDFPGKWPGFLDSVVALLTSGDIRDVGAGCVAALECVRAFRYRQRKDILPEIIEKLFPTLVVIASNMLEQPFSTPEIPAMLHLILKTYKTSILICLSTHQQSAASLVPWGKLLFQVIDLRIPPETVPVDEEEREQSEWWKAKKWAFATLGRLFHRFGNPSQLPSSMKKEYAEFSQSFVHAFAPEIFNKYCAQIRLWITGEVWLSNKCMYHIISFFTECIKPKSTWALLKPEVKNMIEHVIYPYLCFNSSKEVLWNSDPVEYIRLSVDEYDNFCSPVVMAKSFMTSLATNRTRTVFTPMLAIIRDAHSNPDPRKKFGALNMVAVLAPFMTRHPEFKDAMEQSVVQSVLPQLTAEGYLRSIACEVLYTLVENNMQWKSEENLQSHALAVYNALDDSELPVQVHAALAITKMAEVYDSVRDSIGSHVENIIKKLLDLSNKTDLDILNQAMETIVERFQDKLLPVAVDLTASLCNSYLRLARQSLAQQNQPVPNDIDVNSLMSDDDDNKLYAAMGVAKTIGTIVCSIESAPNILAKVQETIIPIVQFTLENKLLDLFDNMYSLVDSLTFETKSIPPTMWPIFELTYTLFKSDAVDFFDEMLPSLDNFLSYGADVFKARPEYCKMAFDIYKTAMENATLGDNDRVNGCKLAESILLNLQGYVDDLLQPIIRIALDNLGKSNTYALKLANLEVLVNALYYNASAALLLMEQCEAGASRKFFDEWFLAINTENKLPTVHDKKLTILALCKLLEVDPSHVPEVLKGGWSSLVSATLNVFKGLQSAIARRKVLEESLVDDHEDSDEDHSKLLNLEGDEDGDVWDEDSAYIEMLANEGARLRELSEKPAGGSEDDESEISEESEIEEDLGFFSKLDMDGIDPYCSFERVLTALQTKQPAAYQAATTILTPDQQTVLMEVMKTAHAQSVANMVKAE